VSIDRDTLRHRRNARIAMIATSCWGTGTGVLLLYRLVSAHAEQQWFAFGVSAVFIAVLLWAFRSVWRMFYLWTQIVRSDVERQQRKLDAPRIAVPVKVQAVVQGPVAQAPAPPPPPSRDAFADEY
jgi:hypothetical protein